MAALLALRFGSAVNLGGGFHHCSADRSQGFCFFADIYLMIRKIWSICVKKKKALAKVMIVDCDAHQGNGYAQDVLQLEPSYKLVF